MGSVISAFLSKRAKFKIFLDIIWLSKDKAKTVSGDAQCPRAAPIAPACLQTQHPGAAPPGSLLETSLAPPEHPNYRGVRIPVQRWARAHSAASGFPGTLAEGTVCAPGLATASVSNPCWNITGDMAGMGTPLAGCTPRLSQPHGLRRTLPVPIPADGEGRDSVGGWLVLLPPAPRSLAGGGVGRCGAAQAPLTAQPAELHPVRVSGPVPAQHPQQPLELLEHPLSLQHPRVR